jgi:hypothetical protein
MGKLPRLQNDEIVNRGLGLRRGAKLPSRSFHTAKGPVHINMMDLLSPFSNDCKLFRTELNNTAAGEPFPPYVKQRLRFCMSPVDHAWGLQIIRSALSRS